MDIKHFYVESGQGEPLILLHGNGEDHTYFQHQMDAFSKQYHVFAIDTRGHGKTPRGDKPFTIRQFAEDLASFFDDHGIKKAHLLGFSDGGNIALMFALLYSDRVSCLILNGANLNPGGVKRSVQIPIEIGYRIAKRFAQKNSSARKKAELLGLMVNDPHIDPTELSSVQAPTLVIAGTKDMIRQKHTERIAKCLPNSRLVLVKGNHFIAAKNPKAFNLAVLAFLEEKA